VEKDRVVIRKEPALINAETHQVIIRSMGWLLRPKTNYCGSFLRKK
jgi:hypothetical protein